MRAMFSLLLVVALPALAEEPTPDEAKKVYDQYEKDAFAICRERNMTGDVEACAPYFEGANFIATMEMSGNPPLNAFTLDVSQEDPEKARAILKQIARTCREETMDGKLVDGFRATLCVQYEVGRRNWEARRAKRLRAED